jgi:hypothetical protein
MSWIICYKLPETSIIVSVIYKGCTSTEDLMLLQEPDIDNAILKDSNGNTVHMPAALKRKILLLHDYYNSWPPADQNLAGWMARDKDDLLRFITLPPPPPAAPTIATSTTPLADEFGNRCLVSNYKPFKDKK